MTSTAPVVIMTFGYLHGDPPPAQIVLDLRTHFRDPHVRPELRTLTAYDAPVREAVLATPGIRDLIAATMAAVAAYLAGPATAPLIVPVGCAGGRHRAATVGIELAQAIADRYGTPLALSHRDIDKDVVDRRP